MYGFFTSTLKSTNFGLGKYGLLWSCKIFDQLVFHWMCEQERERERLREWEGLTMQAMNKRLVNLRYN